MVEETVDVDLRLPGLVEVSRMLVVGLVGLQGGIGLTGIDPALSVHDPGLPEQGTREELQIEAGLADERIGNGLVQVQGHFDVVAHGPGGHRIGDVHVRIDHRIKAGQVARGVRIGQGGGDDIVADLAADLPGHGLPLAGRRLEPEVTVGSDPLAVHQDAHTALMPFGIEVIEGHHIDTLVAEIPFRDHLELLGLLAASCRDESDQTDRAKTPETTHDWLQFFQSYG